MILVKFTGKVSQEVCIRESEHSYGESNFAQHSRRLCSLNKGNSRIFVTAYDEAGEVIRYVAAYDPQHAGIQDCLGIIRDDLHEVEFSAAEEITIGDFGRLLAHAEAHNMLNRGASYIIRDLSLCIEPDKYGSNLNVAYSVKEKLYPSEYYAGYTRARANSQMEDIMASDSMRQEIERIFSRHNSREFMGHPVHYYITAGDTSAADDILDVLIPSLMKNGRLRSGRVCSVSKLAEHAYREENFYNIFDACKGGTVVINLTLKEDKSPFATGFGEIIDYIGKRIAEYGNETLFVFVDISADRNLSDSAKGAILGSADMIHIGEGMGDRDRAVSYLRRLADRTQYSDYRIEELTRYLPADRTEYTVTDVFGAYNRWYGRGLKTHVYRAYAEVDTACLEPEKKKSSPYEELQSMIGLGAVKTVVDQIIAQGKVRRIRRQMGIQDAETSLHMLFYGNPGSAKTTVARLIAQILRKEELLENGHVVECGRQDLVGKYVGWTAKTVEEKFRAARGGILFIDEAYSLVEDGNSYGAEAINTIVQLMENYREDVIVIFAGYPAKMKAFLDKNEGLRSRIAFHLDFADYNADELVDILRLMIARRGFRVESEDVYARCRVIFQGACRVEDFGNGRFVRNFLEHAIMRQANRLVKGATFTVSAASGAIVSRPAPVAAAISREDVITLIEEDFEMIEVKSQPTRRTFGFAG